MNEALTTQPENLDATVEMILDVQEIWMVQSHWEPPTEIEKTQGGNLSKTPDTKRQRTDAGPRLMCFECGKHLSEHPSGTFCRVTGGKGSNFGSQQQNSDLQHVMTFSKPLNDSPPKQVQNPPGTGRRAKARAKAAARASANGNATTTGPREKQTCFQCHKTLAEHPKGRWCPKPPVAPGN